MPSLLLVFGLLASWLDYELNLANDLDRNFDEVSAQAEATGSRLAALTKRHLDKGELELMREDLANWKDEPWLRIAAVVDDAGTVIASSDQQWQGRSADETPADSAWRQAKQRADKMVESMNGDEGDIIVIGGFPITDSGAKLLVVFDRADAVQRAYSDAMRQLSWSAEVMAFFCLCLWAVLHFGVAARLAKLAKSVRGFGEGGTQSIAILGGADEAHDLSEAFSEMGQRLTEREVEQSKLERALVESTERERQRIGHELHDGVGQQLTAALMAANGLHDELSEQVPEFAGKANLLSVQLREAINEVRGLSHRLAPVPLWESGLEHALQALAESTTRSSEVRCVLECPEPVDLKDEAMAGNIYRIAQEAVNNALKHASASEIRIGLERQGSALVLEIDDDGSGLPEPLPGGGGIGLRVMRHRAETMGGTFEFGTAPAGGTRIAVHIAHVL